MDGYNELIDMLRTIVEESNINKRSRRAIAIDYAWKYIGTFYSWGGDDPSGFDCSGFINEILSATGILPRKADISAAGMAEMFKDKKVEKPYAGCLVFYESAENINNVIHVEICINDELSIGASGGGSKTISKDDAIRDNAFIKIRPFRSRSNINSFVDPFR